MTTGGGLTNARSRIVGERTGPLADAIVAAVRLARATRGALANVVRFLAAVITPVGWTVLAAVPVSFVVGYRMGWIELVAVGFGGVILVAIAVLYLVGRGGYAVELTLPHHRVVAGDPAMGVVVVTNTSRRRLLGAKLEVPVGRSLVDIGVPGLARGAESRHEFPLSTRRRGIVVVGPVRAVRADPVGLVRREIVRTPGQELIVHPRTIGVPGSSSGLIRDLEGRATRDLSSSDVSFHALREYAPGDERRTIHWKSTAKTGVYMVRQFEETRRSRIVVALSLAADEYGSAAGFEVAVGAAGSLGLRAIRDAREVSVVVGQTTPEFAKRRVLGVRHLDAMSPGRLLDELASVEVADTSLRMLDVARVAADQVVGISVAYLVCGSNTPAAQLRAASVLFPVGVEVIAVVCNPDAVPGLRRVAGFRVFTIGYLQELQQALSRAATG
ncbi:DUF58 domain-containing protein [Marisediminicola senii]|uniref:DUF58 domain-containing protein n=1 Tax=Marisediminicola senii TaxID=2711233 RepID=UPI0013ED3DD4|nr:DUF58 domain-containing protein [Marisediminicola senii]